MIWDIQSGCAKKGLGNVRGGKERARVTRDILEEGLADG